MRGLLGADLIGFQTAASAVHFMEVACKGATAVRDGANLLVRETGVLRRVSVEVFPVGPDSRRFADLARSSATVGAAARIREDFGTPELILLGVDRLDYTKGIDLRIRAVTALMKNDAFRHRDIQFIQVAMPSRYDLPAYRDLRATVEETLSLANAELTAHGLRPIHFMYEALPTEQVVALYVAADVMLVTSLADGMNLVSKEFVACRDKDDGRLVLSRTTGAAAQLQDAWLVEPADLADLKRGIGAAILAGDAEARGRMVRLREAVFSDDARNWAESFLARLGAPR